MNKKNRNGLIPMPYWLLAITYSLIISNPAKSQDLRFSQFYETPLLLNPALCGSFKGGMQGELDYRNQWSSVAGNGGFNTMSAAFELHNMETHWASGYLAPGISFYNDRAGSASIGTTGAAFTLASGVYLGETSCLSVGLQAGYAQYSVNAAALQWGSQYLNGEFDPTAATGEPSFRSASSYADFSAGISYSYGSEQTANTISDGGMKANFGLAIFHVNEPTVSYFTQSNSGTKLYMRNVVHGMISRRIRDSKISLVPAIVIYLQGPVTEADLGLKLRYALSAKARITQFNANCNLDLGAYLRLNDAVILLAGIQYNSYSMGISYDLNISQLSSATYGKGAFELTLKFLNLNGLKSSDSQNHSALQE